jgi:hypothetical protein
MAPVWLKTVRYSLLFILLDSWPRARMSSAFAIALFKIPFATTHSPQSQTNLLEWDRFERASSAVLLVPSLLSAAIYSFIHSFTATTTALFLVSWRVEFYVVFLSDKNYSLSCKGDETNQRRMPDATRRATHTCKNRAGPNKSAPHWHHRDCKSRQKETRSKTFMRMVVPSHPLLIAKRGSPRRSDHVVLVFCRFSMASIKAAINKQVWWLKWGILLELFAFSDK